MGNAAEVKKLPVPPPVIDGTKPVEMQCLYLPTASHVFGSNTADRYAEVKKPFRDGSKTSGIIWRITAYPSGFVIMEIREGWRIGVADEQQEYKTCWYLVTQGGLHGRVEGYAQ
jgi:hypothetical protein